MRQAPSVSPLCLLALAALPLVTPAQTPGPGQPILPGARGKKPPVPTPSGIASKRVASGLANPVAATHAPDDDTRLFIVERIQARIRILHLIPGEYTLDPVPYLDIDDRVISTGSERGLLGLAFHPQYASNGLFYVNYNRNGDGDTVIAEFQVTGDPDLADPGSERILMTIDQPQSNHNGGWLDFSPLDGYLYIATGDGGNFCDTGTGHTSGIGNAQDIESNKLGKLLRIDPLGGTPYGIPADNPFVGITGDDEIWAYGLRNPWRCSFDRLTGDLYIGDVGQDLREEVDYQPAASPGGENYGWRCQEGNACATNSPSSCPTVTGCTCTPPTPGLTPAIHDYRHLSPPPPAGFVCAVTGGHVYRGDKLPQVYGHYFFADYCGNAIWSFRVDGGVLMDYTNRTPDLTPSLDGFSIGSITSFGEGADGALYLVDDGGEVFKMVPEP